MTTDIWNSGSTKSGYERIARAVARPARLKVKRSSHGNMLPYASSVSEAKKEISELQLFAKATLLSLGAAQSANTSIYLQNTANIGCSLVADSIRRAFVITDAHIAMDSISDIWEKLEKTSSLAEARTRLVLGKLDPPALDERPDWLQTRLNELAEDEADLAPSHPLAIKAADHLIRACLLETEQEIRASVQKAPLGCVLVDWDVGPHMLQWEIQPARLPWPGVKVNALAMDNSSEMPGASSRIFHTAFAVIEHFRKHVHEFVPQRRVCSQSEGS